LAHRHRGQLLDTLASAREGVGQFAGHRYDVVVGRSDPGLCLGEGLRQLLEAEAKRRCDLNGVDDAAIVGAGRLEVSAADVPSDGASHVPVRARSMPYLRENISGFLLQVFERWR